MKFRRKKSEQADESAASASQPADAGPDVADPAAAEDAVGSESVRDHGPWDISEVDVEGEAGRIDLGSILVRVPEGTELQLQVDEKSGQPVAVVIAGEKGAVELRAFAAPRNGDIWDEVRTQIAAEVTRRGGTASEADGPWGPELRVVLSVTTGDGRTGQQPSRVFGIPGPRWMLRATLFGQPAMEPDDAGPIERALREVVVRRGSQPLAPGDQLPLTVPEGLVGDQE